MWIFTRHLDLDASLQRVLVSRFLFALTVNCLMEYELLILFVLLVRVELEQPRRWLGEVMDWTVYSFQACGFIQFQLLLVACYGILLCHQQHMVAPCHGSWQERLEQQLPLKMCYFTVISGLSSCSTFFYAGYVDELMPDVEGQLGNDWYFVQYSGLICGIIYFLQQHLKPQSTGVWPLPVLRWNRIICIWPRCAQLQQALYASLMATLVSAILLLPSNEGDLSCQCCLLSVSVYLNMLVVLQLLLIKQIFGEVMLRQLPLVVIPVPLAECEKGLHEQQLPLTLALELDCPFGLQLQLAKDFHDLMSNSGACKFLQLFQQQGCVAKTPENWLQLRHVLFKRINRFKKRLENSLQSMRVASCTPPEQPVPEPCSPPQTSYAGLRPLVQSVETVSLTSLCSRRYGYDPPSCRSLCKYKEALSQFLCQLRCLQLLWQNLLDPLPTPERCLCEAHAFVWLLKGLVRICVRSVQLKHCSALHKDMEKIFGIFMELEQLTHAYRDLSPDKGCPCISSGKLSRLTTRSINLLVIHYKPYLSLIVRNQQLLDTLRDRLFPK